jgi:hypothetical protein
LILTTPNIHPAELMQVLYLIFAVRWQMPCQLLLQGQSPFAYALTDPGRERERGIGGEKKKRGS